MGAIDISYFSLALGFLMLIIPLSIAYLLKLKLIKSILIAVLRMIIQLFLMGIFLRYIFEWNNPFINVLWIIIMFMVASFTVIGRSELKLKYFLIPIFLSFIIADSLILLFFNGVIIGLDNIVEAKYLIAIGGMLLGNCLRGNVVGLTHFYDNIRRNESSYLYTLSIGATRYETLLPYVKKSLNLALKPTIASIATIGLVSLPGMMTGQLLGGSDPLVAIKYQMAIMIAILVSTMSSICLTIIFTIRVSFDSYGILRKNIFSSKKRNKQK